MTNPPKDLFSLQNAAHLTGLMGLALDAEPEPQPTSGSGRFVPPEVADLAEHFPDLDILERVGLGGMGCVYKARQKHLDRLVALKILPTELGNNPRSAERFAREARALARLVHPNIVTIHDFGEAAGMQFLVMEYMDGMSLRELMEADRLSPQQCIEIMLRTCAALQYAHDAGVVHRDIKPENILFDRNGHLKLADFGLAKLATDSSREVALTGSRQAMGTLHYMAPEQWESPSSVDQRADVYALGVLLYEMTTGRLPLGRFDPPSLVAGTPDTIDEIVMNSMQREPERRYASVREIMEALTETESERMALDAPVSFDDADAGTFTRIVNVGDRMRRWIRESPEDPAMVHSMKNMLRRAVSDQDDTRLIFPLGTFLLCGTVFLVMMTRWVQLPRADVYLTNSTTVFWQMGVESSIRYRSFEIENSWMLLAAGLIFALTCARNRLRFRADLLALILAAYGVTHVVFFLITTFDSPDPRVIVTTAPFICGGIFALLVLDRLLALILRMCSAVMLGARSLPWESWMDGMRTANDRVRVRAAAQNEIALKILAEQGASAKSGLATAGRMAGHGIGTVVPHVVRLTGGLLDSVWRGTLCAGRFLWSRFSRSQPNSKNAPGNLKNPESAANDPSSPLAGE